jgi:hypothetical protein
MNGYSFRNLFRSGMSGLLLVVAVGLLVASPAAAAGRYRAFDYRGPLPDGSNGAATITEVFGINEHLRLVGSYCAENDPNFVTQQGCTSAAGGSNPSHGYVAEASGGTPHGFKPIDYILPSGQRAFESEAIGVNNFGQIIGLYDANKPTPQTSALDTGSGFICQYPCQTHASFRTIVYPGATSTDGSAINDNGVSIGLYALKAKPPFRDFGWMRSASGRFCSIDVGKMGVRGGVDTNALGLNIHGDVVGSYDDPHKGIAGFRLTDVSVPPYKNGQPQTCRADATVWTFKFPVRGVQETEAAGISNDGTIVGNYVDRNGTAHAWRCQPENASAKCSKGNGFQTIDYPGQNGDNAATSLNSLDTPVIVGNFEQTTSTPTKERAWIRFGN